MRRDGKVNARTAPAPTKAKSSTTKPPAAPLSPAPAGASPPAVSLIRPRSGPIPAKLDAAAPSKRHARVSATSESKQIGKDGQPDGPVQPAATHTNERKPTGHRAATRYWDNKLANSLLGEQTTAKSKLVSAMDNPFLLSLAWPTVSTMLKQLHKYNPPQDWPRFTPRTATELLRGHSRRPHCPRLTTHTRTPSPSTR